MDMYRPFASLVVAACTAAGAHAATIGDIIFTDELTNSVNLIADPGGANTVSTLFTFAGWPAHFRPGDIVALPGGDYAIGNSPIDVQDPSEASIERITDLFGTPTTWTIASSDPIQFSHEMEYRAASSELVVVNNPGSAPVIPLRFEGVLGVDPDSGSVSEIYAGFMGGDPPRPRYQGGNALAKDPYSSNYYHTTVNGGEWWNGQPNDENQAGVLFYLDVDAGTVDIVADMSYLITDTPIVKVSGLVALPGDQPGWTDLYLSDLFTDAIYKLRIDDMGNYVDITTLLDGLDKPQAIDYNPYTNKLVFSSVLSSTVQQINLDGTGRETLATGVWARGFEFVPAPSSAMLIGFGGLTLLRRRR
ncbi:MAG: PEP-CTERM sorting domain-containing protein [Phycisphaerales bacterium]|nr:PEP-CTERM sorting domain-containing protein [Phycisphaerales bacterium]